MSKFSNFKVFLILSRFPDLYHVAVTLAKEFVHSTKVYNKDYLHFHFTPLHWFKVLRLDTNCMPKRWGKTLTRISVLPHEMMDILPRWYIFSFWTHTMLVLTSLNEIITKLKMAISFNVIRHLFRSHINVWCYQKVSLLGQAWWVFYRDGRYAPHHLTLPVCDQKTSFESQLISCTSWWRHQMETFSALLALCAGNSPVPVNSPHKGQWRGALIFSLICARINDWVNNREAGDLRRHLGHIDVNVMFEC